MSATAVKWPLAEAIAAAEAFRDFFAGRFLRWEIAGSIRRKRPMVGDVEHVVIPCRHTAGNGLFGQAEDGGCRVHEMLRAMLTQGVVTLSVYPDGRHRNGPKMIGVDFQGLRHEVWFAEPNNWGCILAIRTGSAEFSQALVTRMKGRGYKQVGGFLHRAQRCGWAVEPCERPTYVEIPCRDEATFFVAAGLENSQWPPEMREGPL